MPPVRPTSKGKDAAFAGLVEGFAWGVCITDTGRDLKVEVLLWGLDDEEGL
jgi:hypothetical protein